MDDRSTGSAAEWRALREVAAAATRARAAQERVLLTLASDEILEAVREEARALRLLDEALRDLGKEGTLPGRVPSHG